MSLGLSFHQTTGILKDVTMRHAKCILGVRLGVPVGFTGNPFQLCFNYVYNEVLKLLVKSGDESLLSLLPLFLVHLLIRSFAMNKGFYLLFIF